MKTLKAQYKIKEELKKYFHIGLHSSETLDTWKMMGIKEDALEIVK